MSASARVLLVEDDRQLSGMLAELLRTEGYSVDVAGDGQRGLHLGLTREYDVLVLDRGLPAVEGLDLLARLRAKGVPTPALVLSALSNPADRVEGLDAGAEDYLGKPFDVDELLARLRALRRRAGATPASALEIRLPGGTFDVSARRVDLSDGRSADLSEREASLLELLARRPNRVFSRQEVLDEVFPDAADEGVVDTYVYYVRRKLGRGAVVTVRGLGYRWGAL
ncbi:response regulator transcription factor [Promicromonospora sp. MEB111]|uniref:response regulator transcription factor n=1 Tax=Promicromonospora sp. MEB111 TaxID=3040301 RepID=UPI00254FF56C|nr:response regulator transcription factor [Promicromonospora sp. MEB111]